MEARQSLDSKNNLYQETSLENSSTTESHRLSTQREKNKENEEEEDEDEDPECLKGAEPYKKTKTEGNSKFEMNLKNLSQYYFNIDKEAQSAVQKRISTHQAKFDKIIEVLRGVEFIQAMIFYNDKARGEEMVNDLK